MDVLFFELKVGFIYGIFLIGSFNKSFLKTLQKGHYIQKYQNKQNGWDTLLKAIYPALKG